MQGNNVITGEIVDPVLITETLAKMNTREKARSRWDCDGGDDDRDIAIHKSPNGYVFAIIN